MSQTSNRTWYVLHVKSGAEFKVRAALYRDGHKALVPSEDKLTRYSPSTGERFGRARMCKFPVFARYVFVGIAGKPEWPKITALEPKPIRPVQFDTEPAKLSEQDVSYLSNIRSGDIPAGFNLHKAIKEGELARIASGPFAGLQSKIGKLDGEFAEMEGQVLGASRTLRVPVRQLVAA